MAVILCGEQRISERNGVEGIPEGEGVLLHSVIFNAVDHMGGLYQHIRDAVGCHLLHGLLYCGDNNVVTVFQLPYDHFAGPCPVDRVFGKCLSHGIFNGVNGDLSGVLMAGAEADCQDCFLCLCVHW